MAWPILGAPSTPSRALSISPRLSFSQSETLSSSLPIPRDSLSVTSTPATHSIPSVYCGRGDKKTAIGNRFNHSFGNFKKKNVPARPRNKSKGRGPPRLPIPPSPPKKDKYDDNEIIKIEIDESLFN